MKQRIKELGDAINETLANSDQIAEVISRIKSEGYDVFLVLEATVGFSQTDADKVPAGEQPEEANENQAPPDFKVNMQDLRFLKSLRISVEEKKAA